MSSVRRRYSSSSRSPRSAHAPASTRQLANLHARKEGDPNPFIDLAGYLAHVDPQEGNFQQMFQEQTAAAR